MTLRKKVFRALVCFALMHVYSCGRVGWLPSLSLAVAGIDRTEYQPDQTDRKRLILKAEARLKWQLKPLPNQSISQPIDDRRTALSDINYQMGQIDALHEWERRERNRVIDESNQGWRQ
jgi:NaMN:DMB phosphoribosyltransferase